MPESNVARRYAKGAFQQASEQRDLDGWRQQIGRLDALLAEDVLKAAFANPAVDMPRRMELAQRFSADLEPGPQNFLRLLIEHRRTGEMAAIRREFDALADEAQGIVLATLTTAVPISAGDHKAFEKGLATRLRRDVTLRHSIDPALIGGATIQIGDRLVDGSIRTQLQRLRQDLAG